MQFTTGLVLLAQAVGVFSSAVARDVAGECGELGVMQRTGLPVGVDQSSVRMCTNGPSGPSGSPLTGSLDSRACWYGADSGCSKSGYCWARCGQPEAGTFPSATSILSFPLIPSRDTRYKLT